MDVSSLVASPAIKILIPKGFDFIWHKIVGKKILICGLGRSGKTSFQKYLSRGILLKERDTEKTYEHEKIPDAKIVINSKSNFILRLTSSFDSPGQLGTIVQAASISDYRPDYLFIFLDCSRKQESLVWLADFCENLDACFKKDPYLSKDLKNIYIVLNKYDKLKNKKKLSAVQQYKTFESKVKSILEINLKHSFYHSLMKIRIPQVFPSICVKTKYGVGQIDELINSFASNSL